VDFDVRWGEIHALVGENGAGKSTLMRIIAGLDTPDAGAVNVDGRRVTDFDPRRLSDQGVALVQQHFTMVPTFTAEENISLARPLGRLRPSRAAMRRRLHDLSELHGLDVRAGIPTEQLSVGERQRLEILRALDADARILILDEPTAVLTDAEADRLLGLCRHLADQGRAVIIVTHRLGEVLRGCDRATVLRRGTVALLGDDVANHTRSTLATLMVGAPATGTYEHVERAPRVAGGTGPRIRLEQVSLGRLVDCSLDIYPGEIVGVAGVDGNGQAELERLLAGIDQPESGRVTGLPHDPKHPRARVSSGIAYIPSDRYQRALASELTIADNLELGRGPWWRRRRGQREHQASGALSRWDVRGGSPRTPVVSLSGGNAQKVVLAREVDGHAGIVIAGYPVRGLDPGASDTITRRIIAAADDGAAVVWFGAELDELLAVCDRMIVLVAGEPVQHFAAPFDRDAVAVAMGGTKVPVRA
jgi:simple sugar transport system ATP-binding protein